MKQMADEEDRRKRKVEVEEEYAGKKPKTSHAQQSTGYTQELKVLSFADSHAMEIRALRDDIIVRQGGKLVTQKLPRHMRRRAMSHNVKRLPRNIHSLAKGVYANQKGIIRKRPSRYHRRRPKNLLQEYQRRNRKHRWLETHIWHAKRFHMVEKWGFKLAWKPTDKSHRAAYRATKDHCLLQDISYMCCIELSGDPVHLIDRLSHITSTETGQTFASKACLSGTREGETVLYEVDRYPWKAIGPVSFMWNPECFVKQSSKSSLNSNKNGETSNRTMWIWCHPCIFDSVWEELCKCLEIKETAIEKMAKNGDENTESEAVENKVDKEVIIDRFKTEVVATNKQLNVSMKSLSGSILRFRLTGPQSNVVLADTLRQASVIPVSEKTDCSDPWWKSYYAREEMALCHGAQRQFMDGLVDCQSPAELSPHCVVATLVQDPRLGRPVKRTKVEGQKNCVSTDTSFCKQKVTPDLAMSPIWDERIRNEVVNTKQPDYKIYELKSEMLVPGTPLELGDDESKIPVILIQRPGVAANRSTLNDPCPGLGSGWDLLLPKAWAMPFWLALVFRGARCGGLMEQECSVYEERSLLFPHNYPDTQAGLKHHSDVEDTFLAKYNRTPAAKRPNFTKLGVSFPYNSPWNLLIKHWNGIQSAVDGNENVLEKLEGSSEEKGDQNKPSSQIQKMDCQKNTSPFEHPDKKGEAASKEIIENCRNYFVLRNSRILRHLHLEGVGKDKRHNKSINGGFKTTKSILDDIENKYLNALIPVRIEMNIKGVLRDFAMICAPLNEDILALCENANYTGPVEPKHVDPKLIQRKKLKQEMKLKKLKKKVKIDRTLCKIADNPNLTLDSTSRKIIGFVSKGGQSLATGSGSGVGFVSAVGLSFLIRNSARTNHKWTVLVRNNTSLQYRYARLLVLS